MQVVYLANVGLAKNQVAERLRAVPGTELTVVESIDEMLAVLPRMQGLVLWDPPLAAARRLAEALKAPGRNLRWMHFLSAGRENMETAGLPDDLKVTYMPGAVAPVVAEHAMALLLALYRRIPETLAAQAAGKWDRGMAPGSRSLEGGTMAIVGYGHIGKELAKRARGFGMKVVSVSRTPKDDPLLDAAHPLDQFQAVLGKADAVVASIALTPATRHLFGTEAFAAMKRGSVLINVARGGVVDQAALVKALESGQLGGAGLDVTEPEPLPEGDPLWRAPNLILSPHYAGAGSPSSIERIVSGVAENLRQFIAGQT